MLGKCLWKMHRFNADAIIFAAQHNEPLPQNKGPSWEEVIDAFVNAIETLPEKRERGREPILEPHYKLVSIAHKLFQRKAIDHEKGQHIISHTSYSQNIKAPEGADDWGRYVLAVLKALRAADKSSWHHRIIARSAHVIYDDSNDTAAAYNAKHELTQQMFTKTMTVQVWKPEHERPGRHFVYTSRYTRFFIQLLDQTGDKTNMEMLAKRVRKKQTDFFEHSKLWQELCTQYLSLLRRIGGIFAGHEDSVFKQVNHDEFIILASRVEAWTQDPSTQHPVLDVLRDAIELKKLNNGLMKVVAIDDLIGDTYGLLYATIGPTLPPLSSEQHQQSQQPQTGSSTPGQSGPGPLPVASLGQIQVDGVVDPASNPNLPFSIYHPSQLNQLQAQQPDTAARPRAKAIGRREIQRKAEAASVRPAVPVAAPVTVPTLPIRSPLAPQPQVIIPKMSPEKTEPNEQSPTKANEQLQVPASGVATAATSVGNVEDSAPASLHDDADDESELSELDESEVREMEADVRDASREETVHVKTGFSNLHRAKEIAADGASSAVESAAVSEDNVTTEEK